MAEAYLGEIRLFPYTFAPDGWLDCDGSLQSIATNEYLYQLLGTTYGGDGINTFALPDLRGRVPIHQGTGPGLSPYGLGQMAGTETVTLLPNQIPSHTHPFAAVDISANGNTPGPKVQLGSVSGDTLYTNDITGVASAALAAGAVDAFGGSQPHDNTMPTLAVRFCICTAGVYPQQY